MAPGKRVWERLIAGARSTRELMSQQSCGCSPRRSRPARHADRGTVAAPQTRSATACLTLIRVDDVSPRMHFPLEVVSMPVVAVSRYRAVVAISALALLASACADSTSPKPSFPPFTGERYALVALDGQALPAPTGRVSAATPRQHRGRRRGYRRVQHLTVGVRAAGRRHAHLAHRGPGTV